MQSSWQIEIFIISSLLIAVLCAHSMISINRNLRRRQTRRRDSMTPLPYWKRHEEA